MKGVKPHEANYGPYAPTRKTTKVENNQLPYYVKKLNNAAEKKGASGFLGHQALSNFIENS
jgi:hypothetical protein